MRKKNTSEKIEPPEFRTRLDLAESVTVVFPLSRKVAALLEHYSEESLGDTPSNVDDLLISSLNQLIWDSPKLWENPVRGVVVKCSEEIVAKVITGNQDYTEYTSMQYLAERVPGIPVLRPHGLIAFGPFRVIFMSYIPGVTLTQAWPNLPDQEKQLIQDQLDAIFCKIRTLRQVNGNVLGGVCGKGVKEPQVDECALFKGITTVAGFENLQFSARHHGSNTYAEFVRSFLNQDYSTSMHESVFTHGDVRTDNVMVKQDFESNDGRYIVTGIIDWEDSGFYPEYYECTALSRTLSLVAENDWYRYIPDSISPSQFPIRWLVDRLWGIHLRTT